MIVEESIRRLQQPRGWKLDDLLLRNNKPGIEAWNGLVLVKRKRGGDDVKIHGGSMIVEESIRRLQQPRGMEIRGVDISDDGTTIVIGAFANDVSARHQHHNVSIHSTATCTPRSINLTSRTVINSPSPYISIRPITLATATTATSANKSDGVTIIESSSVDS